LYAREYLGFAKSKTRHIFSRLAVLLAGKHKMKAGFSARRAELGQMESLEVVISVTHVHSNNLSEVDVHH
jgi:peptide subunit release factor 1 (eRF1)